MNKNLSSVVLLLIALIFTHCGTSENSELTGTVTETVVPTFKRYNGDIIQYQIIHTELGYGYDIIVNDRVAIHQPFVPCVQGKQGFATYEQAQTLAEYLSKKATIGSFPPPLTMEEMDSLKVLD